jgi:hypothetical protein
MKRVALLTVFFYVCTFASPQRAQAVVPVALIAAAAVGTAMMSASVGTYYAQHGVLPQYVSTTANAVASAADKIFQPSYLAVGAYSLLTPTSLNTAKDYYIGQAAAVGAKIGDIVSAVSNSAESSYTALKNLIATCKNASPLFFDNMPPAGAIIQGATGAKFILGSSWNRHASVFDDPQGQIVAQGYLPIPGWSGAYWKPNSWLLVRTNDVDGYAPRYWYNSQWPNVVSSGDPVVPPDTGINYPSLKDALNPTVPAGVANEIPKLLKDLPASKLTAATATPASVAEESAPPAITQADINAALKANTAAVAQAVSQAAADIAAANPDDAAAQIAAAQAALEAAKAAEEAAKEEPAEETFSPISDTAFTEPYNPGEFDIPARFTTFLNNVKSSGLFSFSNDFFNSLPGGGSPVYEIEAGRYGHHSIDLSVTLSTGLAILKTILLACFGFLSIRAVIMKR